MQIIVNTNPLFSFSIFFVLQVYGTYSFMHLEFRMNRIFF